MHLDLGIFELVADEALCIEDGVDGVHCAQILQGIAAEALGVGEGDIGWGGVVALIVGNDLDMIMLLDTDAGGYDTKTEADSF